MAFCGGCGAELAPDMRFCGGCGKSIAQSSSAPEPLLGDTGKALASSALAFGATAASAARDAAASAVARTRDAAEGHSVIGDGNVVYDEQIIAEYANFMYRRAFWVVVITTVIWAVIGGIIGSVIGGLAGRMIGGDGSGSLGFVALIGGGVLGFWSGQQKAFWLKLAAQVALCQTQIERNTRGSSAS